VISLDRVVTVWLYSARETNVCAASVSVRKLGGGDGGGGDGGGEGGGGDGGGGDGGGGEGGGGEGAAAGAQPAGARRTEGGAEVRVGEQPGEARDEDGEAVAAIGLYQEGLGEVIDAEPAALRSEASSQSCRVRRSPVRLLAMTLD